MSRMTFPLCLSLFFLSPPSFAYQDVDPDTPARAVVQQFLRFRQDLNQDDLMTTVDVPWYHDGKSVITDRAELAAEFKALLIRPNQEKVSFEIRRLMPYRAVQEKFTEDERRMADRVLQPEDRVALIVVRPVSTDTERKILLFVRMRDGQAKVVGLMN